jgi:hypothetical protein
MNALKEIVTYQKQANKLVSERRIAGVHSKSQVISSQTNKNASEKSLLKDKSFLSVANNNRTDPKFFRHPSSFNVTAIRFDPRARKFSGPDFIPQRSTLSTLSTSFSRSQRPPVGIQYALKNPGPGDYQPKYILDNKHLIVRLHQKEGKTFGLPYSAYRKVKEYAIS